MREDILEGVTADLPSIPPLIFREILGKLIKTTLTDVRADIMPLHFEIIRLLDKECKLHVTEIGNRLRIAKTQMNKLTDKLVGLQLVARQTDVTDRRTCIIALSPRVKTVLEEQRASIMNAIRGTMRQLSDEDLKDLSDTLRKLQDILSRLH